MDQARKAGQTPGSGAPDGTFAAGVNRVTELLPVLLTDILNTAPDDQKVRFRITAKSLEKTLVLVFYFLCISFVDCTLPMTFSEISSGIGMDSTYV